MHFMKYLQILVLLFCCSCGSDIDWNLKTVRNNKVQTILDSAESQKDNLYLRLKLLDSAFNIKSLGKVDSLFLATIYLKSNTHYYLKQFDSANYYDNYLKMQAKVISSAYYLGKVHFNLAIQFRNEQRLDSAYYHYNQSKKYSEKLGDSVQIGRRLISMGIIQQYNGDYFGSKESLVEALKYLEEKKDSNSTASAYNELATNNKKLLNSTDAVDNYKKAIKLTTSQNNRLTFQNNLATVFRENKKYDESEKILKNILADSLAIKNPSNYARVLDNLAYSQWLDTQQVKEQEFLRALRIRKTENDKRGQIASYTHLGEFFSKQNPVKAVQYLDTVIHLSKQLKIPKAEQDALKFKMNLQPNNVKIRNRYVFLQDSLYRIGLKVKTQFAKMKYDDELKQRAIFELEAETAKKNTALAEQKTQKTIWLSTSGLLLFVGISFFYAFRQRHKKEKLQEVYATEKRLSKKVHDELANDLYGAMAKIQHDPNFEKEEMLDDLERIYRQTRNISHENAEIPTGADFVPNLKQLLGMYRNENTLITVNGLESNVFKNLEHYKKIAVHRVLNELMVNMKKHSNANLVSVTFETLKKTLILKYADNGSGAPPNINKGIGLQNTENRIKSIGGTFSFDSKPGKGVKVRCTFPL